MVRRLAVLIIGAVLGTTVVLLTPVPAAAELGATLRGTCGSAYFQGETDAPYVVIEVFDPSLGAVGEDVVHRSYEVDDDGGFEIFVTYPTAATGTALEWFAWGSPTSDPDDYDGEVYLEVVEPCEAEQPRFSDVPLSHPFADDVAWVYEMGVAQGDGGRYRDSDPVSRQAMAAFLYRATGAMHESPATATFSDVPVGSQFFRNVEWLVHAGIANGYTPTTFGPVRPVSRQAMAAFIYRAFGSPPYDCGPDTVIMFADAQGTPFQCEISWLVEARIANGFSDGTFRPTAPVSRQAMAAFLHRAFDRPVVDELLPD